MSDLRPGSRRRVQDKLHTELNAIAANEHYHNMGPTPDQIRCLHDLGYTRPVATGTEARMILGRLIRESRNVKGKWTVRV